MYPSETAFMDCEGLPPVMDRFDQPWYFVGEVAKDIGHVHALCHYCASRAKPLSFSSPSVVVESFSTVVMESFLFVTDDMLEVMIYFGVCDKCDGVHWARQGPPFHRARRCVGV